MKYYISPDNPQVIKNCLHDIGGLHPEKKWIIEVKERKKYFTEKQRNYWHKLIDIISKDQGDTPEDIKMRLKYSVLPLIEVEVRGVTYMYPISSEKLDRKAYGDLITATEELARILGISLPPPSYYGMEHRQKEER